MLCFLTFWFSYEEHLNTSTHQRYYISLVVDLHLHKKTCVIKTGGDWLQHCRMMLFIHSVLKFTGQMSFAPTIGMEAYSSMCGRWYCSYRHAIMLRCEDTVPLGRLKEKFIFKKVISTWLVNVTRPTLLMVVCLRLAVFSASPKYGK